MSDGVSQPEHQQGTTGTGKTGAAESGSFFHAYTKQEQSRGGLRYFLYAGAILLLIGLGSLFIRIEPEATPFRVDTAWGLRTVRKGMSPKEVQSLLGQPTSKERRGNLECYEYGKPTINAPDFKLHVVCYEDGKLREVSEKRYNSWVVTNDGAISPAPCRLLPRTRPRLTRRASPTRPRRSRAGPRAQRERPRAWRAMASASRSGAPSAAPKKSRGSMTSNSCSSGLPSGPVARSTRA
jgi:hypothetical protein